jgi:hypothetical protein
VERGEGGQNFGRRKTQLCTLSISNPLWLKVLKRLWRIHGKYLGVFVDYAKCFYEYTENTTNLGWFAVHKIGAFNIKTTYLTIVLENNGSKKPLFQPSE